MRDYNELSSQTESNGGEISSPIPLSDLAFVKECFGTYQSPDGLKRDWSEIKNRET